MENDALFKTLLNLPGVEILEVRVNREGHCLIRVESVGDRTRCHICGKEIHHSYGYDRDIKLRHWPIFDRESYIVLRPKRYQCLRCHGRPTTTERLSWYEPKRPHTKAYEERILLLLINSTVEDVSLKEGIGYDAVSGVMASHIDAEIDWQEVKGLKVIGIDEISLKKGHKDFVTIVTALVGTQMRILGVLGDRKKATVKAFFSGIPKRIRKTLRTVCCDMYDGFVNAAKEVFGSKVKVVADRFHVAKLYRGGLDKLRKSELKRLQKALPEAEYKKLKGVMWLLRNDPSELTEVEWETLTLLFKHSPSLKLAYEFSHQLTEIFNEKIQRSRARHKIGSWSRRVKKSGLKCFDTFLSTLTQRMEEVLNYFIDRHSSGFVEGLNNKIKVIKRRCYGIFRTDQLFRRIHLDLSGYELFA